MDCYLENHAELYGSNKVHENALCYTSSYLRTKLKIYGVTLTSKSLLPAGNIFFINVLSPLKNYLAVIFILYRQNLAKILPLGNF